MICGWPAPPPCTLGIRAISAWTAIVRGFRIATGRADQSGGGAFLIIQQRFQHMFGGDPLVELADRDRTGGLQETLRVRSVNFWMSILMSLFVGDLV